MASYSLLVSLGFLILFYGCSAQIEQVLSQGQGPFGRHPLRYRSKCQLKNLSTLKPSRKVEAEAGVTELWDEYEEELQCAGAAALRHVIRRNGLLLPSFTNAPELLYVVQGRGLQGVIIPGCPETYQSDESRSQGQGRGSESRGDRHQKVRQIEEGDILALPAGVTHWIYNEGQSDLVLMSVLFTSSEENQLDQNIRKFFLAGNPQQGGSGKWHGQSQSKGGQGGQQQQQKSFGNLFGGLATDLLSDSFNIDDELASRLKSKDDRRGHIIEVQGDLRILSPQKELEEWEQEREQQQGRPHGNRRSSHSSSDDSNGLEETICTLRLKQNVDNPEFADVYNPRAGRITTLNSFSLPVLRNLQLSVEKTVLYKNAIVPPRYCMNGHGLLYVTRGSGRIQIVGDWGQTAFDGEVQEGQLLVIPQNFVVIKKAGKQGFEFVTFRTNDVAMVSTLAGRLSVFRSLPEEVIQNSYGISREESRRLKYGREEFQVFSPRSHSSQ